MAAAAVQPQRRLVGVNDIVALKRVDCVRFWWRLSVITWYTWM